jgi:uncharacterized protein (UPF0332 family)
LADAANALETSGRPKAIGRDAYFAVLAAARALIFHQTGKVVKTHAGARSEISRLAHHDPRIDRRFEPFLADGFELKSWADYGDGRPRNISSDVAQHMVATARELVDHAEWLLAQPEPPAPA